jgi:hypothetical protein
MLQPKNSIAVVMAVLGIAACTAAPRVARAQSTLVHTLPRSRSSIPPGPFDVGAPNMRAASRIAGCYALTLGAWTPPQTLGDTLPVPSRIELSIEPHSRLYIGFRLVARTPGSSPQTDKYPAGWSTIGNDSLQLRLWSNGSGSLALFLRSAPDSALRGTARLFAGPERRDDTGRWAWERYPTAPVTLRPMACNGWAGRQSDKLYRSPRRADAASESRVARGGDPRSQRAGAC